MHADREEVRKAPLRQVKPGRPYPTTNKYFISLIPNPFTPQAVGEIQCCSDKGKCTRFDKKKCISGDAATGDKKMYTYCEAEDACAKLGLRLCTKKELLTKGVVALNPTLNVKRDPRTLTPNRCSRLLRNWVLARLRGGLDQRRKAAPW